MDYELKYNLDKYQKEVQDIRFNSQNLHYGVLSLSERWDSTLMWSHYADCHKGYCIGFSEKKLRESGLFGRGGRVIYNPDNDFPPIDPLSSDMLDKAFKETHYKAKDWSYEMEYRLTKLFHPDIPQSKDRIVAFAEDFITEIIIGIETSESDKNEIIEIAKQKKIKVFQAEKVPFKFEINKTEVK